MPELTVENVYATLQQFMLDADTIFRRGMANVFSKLDRRFRSHDGFKIGARMILTMRSIVSRQSELGQRSRPADRRGARVRHSRRTPGSEFHVRALRLEASRSGGYGPKQSYLETDYFRIRGFKNGNAHLWFVRDDLVEKVNKLLAEYYGEVIGDGQTQEENPFDKKTQPSLFDPPSIQRAAIIPRGAVFHFAGRALRVRACSARSPATW
jgi:hypothetical protein